MFTSVVAELNFSFWFDLSLLELERKSVAKPNEQVVEGPMGDVSSNFLGGKHVSPEGGCLELENQRRGRRVSDRSAVRREIGLGHVFTRPCFHSAVFSSTMFSTRPCLALDHVFTRPCFHSAMFLLRHV